MKPGSAAHPVDAAAVNPPLPAAYVESAKRWLGQNTRRYDNSVQKVLTRAALRQTLSEDLNRAFDKAATLGERLADQVSQFGGSWTFIMMFGGFLCCWAVLNTLLLGTAAFDPYPYIFLNLVLSMLAAIQAPVIMMSQSRVSKRDRLMAQHDYEVNLKAEIEILSLHEKLDELRTGHLLTLVTQQKTQIELLAKLVQEVTKDQPTNGLASAK